MFFPFNDRFCFFTQVCKDRRTDDQDQVFKKRKIKKYHCQPQHHACHYKEKTQPFTSFFLKPGLNTQFAADPGDDPIGRLPEDEHANDKEEGIYNTGDDDPAEQPVLFNEPLGFSPGLDCYYDFFEQSLNLGGKYRPLITLSKMIYRVSRFLFYCFMWDFNV